MPALRIELGVLPYEPNVLPTSYADTVVGTNEIDYI